MNKTYIPRETYLETIRPFFGKDVIKVIVGQRRVGKSYLLFQIMDALVSERRVKKTELLYLNKELHEYDDIRTHTDLIRLVERESKKRTVKALLLDEVQDIEGFEKALRSFQARGNYDIYITGSNAFFLSSELSTYLSGRTVQFEVFPLSYREFLEFHKREDSDESLSRYMTYGGLPYLANLALSDEVVFPYLESVYHTIILKDVVKKHSIRNVAFLDRLVEYVADNVGSIVSAKRISDFLKSQRTRLSPSVVLNYLSYLAGAFFIARVPRSDIVGKKIFEINEKYYFGDLGLRHALVGFRQVDIGRILENVVYLHLRTQGWNVTVGQLDSREIDFVCERKGERMYVQVAYLITDEKARKREFGNLLEVPDNYPKFVVSLDQSAGGTYQGIHHFHARDFLLSMNP